MVPSSEGNSCAPASARDRPRRAKILDLVGRPIAAQRLREGTSISERALDETECRRAGSAGHRRIAGSVLQTTSGGVSQGREMRQ